MFSNIWHNLFFCMLNAGMIVAILYLWSQMMQIMGRLKQIIDIKNAIVARIAILESKMGYSVTNIEIDKVSQH